MRVLARLLLCSAFTLPLFAGGDLFEGRVIEVKSGAVVMVETDAARYEVKIIGIVPPAREGSSASRARERVSTLVMGKLIRVRYFRRDRDGTMVGQIYVGDPGIDVGIELLKAGLVRKQPEFDFPKGELAAAERQARRAKRGLWAGQ